MQPISGERTHIMRRKFRDRKISKDNQKDLAVMATIWHTMATRDARLLRH